jgi:hypothetical protein
VGDARQYSGDLPDGVESVDALVAELVASVGQAVTWLSRVTGVPVPVWLDEVDEAVGRAGTTSDPGGTA